MLDMARATMCVPALTLLVAFCSPTSPEDAIAEGAWGGSHIALDVTSTGAHVEFDCAHGSIDEPLALTNGKFAVRGSYTPERGGPVRDDQPEQNRPARYSGNLRDATITLTILVTDTSETLGPYALKRGTGRVLKCR